jgi:hypothetical protein
MAQGKNSIIEQAETKGNLFMLTSFDTTLPRCETSGQELSFSFSDSKQDIDLSPARKATYTAKTAHPALAKPRNTDKDPTFTKISDQISALADQIDHKYRYSARLSADSRLLRLRIQALSVQLASPQVDISETVLPTCSICSLF